MLLAMLVVEALLAGRMIGKEAATDREGVTVMFWNLENFFDFKDDGTGESDREFSAAGERRWTKSRFYRKCQAVAKTVLWAGLPDIVGAAEVENRFVLRQLVTKTALRKLDYEIVHFDSPDPRGIDCALLYRASRLTLVSAKPCPVSAPGLQTRDILLTQFLTPSGDSLAVLVNHHPSKYGGGETDWRREVAVARLRALGDSLAASGWTRAVAVGDFNDTPDNALFNSLAPALSLCRMTGPTAENIREDLPAEGDADERTFSRNGSAPPGRGISRRELSASHSAGRQSLKGRGSIRFNGEWQLIDLSPGKSLPARNPGSIRFNGEWQLIDLCFVSPALADDASFRVLEPPFLTERDAAHSGDRPLRTYSGPRYLGGVSDHRPILVHICPSSPSPSPSPSTFSFAFPSLSPSPSSSTFISPATFTSSFTSSFISAFAFPFLQSPFSLSSPPVPLCNPVSPQSLSPRGSVSFHPPSTSTLETACT